MRLLENDREDALLVQFTLLNQATVFNQELAYDIAGYAGALFDIEDQIDPDYIECEAYPRKHEWGTVISPCIIFHACPIELRNQSSSIQDYYEHPRYANLTIKVDTTNPLPPFIKPCCSVADQARFTRLLTLAMKRGHDARQSLAITFLRGWSIEHIEEFAPYQQEIFEDLGYITSLRLS